MFTITIKLISWIGKPSKQQKCALLFRLGAHKERRGTAAGNQFHRAKNKSEERRIRRNEAIAKASSLIGTDRRNVVFSHEQRRICRGNRRNAGTRNDGNQPKYCARRRGTSRRPGSDHPGPFWAEAEGGYAGVLLRGGCQATGHGELPSPGDQQQPDRRKG